MSSVEHSPQPEREADAPPFWLTPPAYWLPAHFPVSAWRTHAPFAAWLVDALRPERVVELGTHYGYSAFAFAEAGKRLGIPMSVHALDTWRGDEHAGFYDDDVFQYVQKVAHDDYPQSVHLHRGYFSDSRERFAAGSVDLLHIDGRHGYDDVLADYSEWRDTVREGGVVLFHDIAETLNGFGVWRLWEEIAAPGDSFAFEHGHGLGVLFVGEPRTPALRSLLSADAAETEQIRADFARLGQVCERQAWLLTLPDELEHVRADVRARTENDARLSSTLDALQIHVTQLEAAIDDIYESNSWRVTRPLRALGRMRLGRSG